MNNRKKRLIIGVLWPSFGMASVISGIIFSIIDPLQLAQQKGFHNLSEIAAYSIGFFFFWAALACTAYFSILFSNKRTQ